MLRFLTLLSLPFLLHAEIYYRFANIQANYLDWLHQTEIKADQKDFFYFTLEGGAGWQWGEFYGNANIENPNRHYGDAAANNLRYTAFGDFDIKTTNGFRIHLQDFVLEGKEFRSNDFVVGVSYKYRAVNGFWIKPFIGLHKTDSTYYHGWNGFMAGWVFDAPFDLLARHFSLAGWNEIEFDRDEKFYLGDNGAAVGDGNSWGD